MRRITANAAAHHTAALHLPYTTCPCEAGLRRLISGAHSAAAVHTMYMAAGGIAAVAFGPQRDTAGGIGQLMFDIW